MKREEITLLPNAQKEEILSRRKRKNIRREKPPENFVKINFDGACHPSNASTSGFIIRDDGGRVILWEHKACGSQLVLMAKAFSLRNGVSAALCLGLKKIMIEGDNLRIINAINGFWSCPWEVEMILADVLVSP